MSGTLVITVDPAWPPVSGADHRNWRIAVACARLGPVRLVSVLGGAPSPPAPDANVTSGVLTQARSADVYKRPPGGSAVDLSLPAELFPAVEAEWITARPDRVIVEHLALHPLFDMLRNKPSRLVLDMHNVESDLVAQRATGLRRLVNWDRAKVNAVRRIEREACARAAAIWTCSAGDADRLTELHGAMPRVFVVPNGIPNADAIPRELPPHRASDAPLLLFVGHLGYGPNLVAAERLAREILPRVHRLMPRARLMLAGRNPHARVRALAGDRIEIVSNPRDVAPLLAAADYAVAPLTMGSGTRIKILEAMAWGLPVVATHLAVAGLGVGDGVEARLAETADEFARAIHLLQADPAAYSRQRDAARAFAIDRFGPEATARAVAAGLGFSNDDRSA
jgi:glycosyltransferase involved in cell wall biosynthesis